jgi:hypothetical protein
MAGPRLKTQVFKDGPLAREATYRRLIRWEDTRSLAEVCHLPALARAAELLGLVLEKPEAQGDYVDISVTPAPPGYSLSTRSSGLTADDALQLTHYLTAMIPWSFFALCDQPILHASSCVVDGEAVLFCGGSETGKTSLVTAAWQMGFSVINDDCTVIDSTSGTVRPFPQGMSIRLEKPVIPEPLAEQLGKQGPYCLGRGWKSDHWLIVGRTVKGFVPYGKSIPVRALYLIRRGSVTRRFPATREAALGNLLGQTFPTRVDRLAILSFVEALWRGQRVYELEVGEGDIAGAATLALSSF